MPKAPAGKSAHSIPEATDSGGARRGLPGRVGLDGGLQQLRQCLCWSGAERQGSPVHETGKRGVQEEFPVRMEDT